MEKDFEIRFFQAVEILLDIMYAWLPPLLDSFEHPCSVLEHIGPREVFGGLAYEQHTGA